MSADRTATDLPPSPLDLLEIEAELGAHTYNPLDVVLTRGEGVWLWDANGRRYLDCLSAYSAVNQGHCHPRNLAALVDQARTLTITSRAFHNDQLALFYKEVCELTRSHKVLPMNSGAEAVESAIKTVRKWGYEVKGVPEGQSRDHRLPPITSTDGRSPSSVSAPIPPRRRTSAPSRPASGSVPFGDADALEAAITPNTVAFLVEPIQGEAGVIIPPMATSTLFGRSARATTSCSSSTRSRPASGARGSCSPRSTRASRPT